jgi:hypothetical protein
MVAEIHMMTQLILETLVSMGHQAIAGMIQAVASFNPSL